MNSYSLIPITTQAVSTNSGYSYQLVLSDSKPTIINRLGRITGRTVKFFKKAETKSAALVSYWAVETLLFAAIMLAATSSFIFFSALFLYLYGTYAIFSAVNALTK